MAKIAFVFPGVGSHYSGMGEFFYTNFKVAKETFEEASDVLTMDFKNLCFSKEQYSELNKLENSQSALVCVSMAIFRVLSKEFGIKPHYCLGYSLGEYAALCCAGAIKFEDGLMIVKERGIIISEEASKINGTMAWVVNINAIEVEKICQNSEVFISAYDSQQKVTISGTVEAISTVGKKIEKEGGLVFPIKMSGPFHCPLMNNAANKFKTVLDLYSYENPYIPVVANINALPYTGHIDVAMNLSLQLVQPIRWQDSIQYLIFQGVKAVIEVGPKNLLCYIIKMNTNKIQTFSLDKGNDLEIIKEKFLVN